MTEPKGISIRANDSGSVEVIRFEPVVIATFEQRHYAELFVDALKGDQPFKTARKPEPPSPQPIIPAKNPTPAPEPDKSAEQPAPPPEKPESKQPAQAKPPKQKSAQVPDFMSKSEPTDEDWNLALDRIASGERVKDVAEDVGLPFGKLRSKWALAVQKGTHQKPGSDEPVSGGVAGVLGRGKGFTWTEEQDAAILAARPEFIPELARQYRMSDSVVRDRKVALETRLSKMMQED